MSLTEPIKQSGNKKVYDNKDVRVITVRGRKITITIANIIFVGGKLLKASTKVILLEDIQDMRVKKV